jgi:hypothetical protein
MMRRVPHVAALCSLIVVVACRGNDRALPPLDSASMVLPLWDSATVMLVKGTGELRDASGLRVAEAGLTDWRAVGDFDANGSEEAVVVAWSSGGGSGVFVELALFGLERGGWMSDDVWRWRASAPLGDRVRVRALTVDGDVVEVHLTRHAPDDPACCPTQEDRLGFRVEGGGLEERGPRGS